jgi:hypothetical protein
VADIYTITIEVATVVFEMILKNVGCRDAQVRRVFYNGQTVFTIGSISLAIGSIVMRCDILIQW